MKKSKNKNGSKKGLCSGKIKPLRPYSPEQMGVTEAYLMEQLYRYALPVDVLLDAAIKRACRTEVRELIQDFGDYNIVRIPKTGVVPEGAKRLDYFLYLTRDKIGMPLKYFLVYLGDEATKSELTTDISMRTKIPKEEVPKAHTAVIRFFRDVIEDRHHKEKRDWGVFRPVDLLGTPVTYNIGTVNVNNY